MPVRDYATRRRIVVFVVLALALFALGVLLLMAPLTRSSSTSQEPPTPIASEYTQLVLREAATAISTSMGATASPQPLPSMFERVSLGTAFDNTKDCDIIDSRPSPVTFSSDTAQLAFQVDFDHTKVQNIRAIIDGDMGGETTAIDCNKYMVIENIVRLTQIGATIKRSDGLPFKPGLFQLKVFVDNKVEPEIVVPFEVKGS